MSLDEQDVVDAPEDEAEPKLELEVKIDSPSACERHITVTIGRDDIERYVESGEWQGKAGGYAIQGLAGGFVVRLVGSYSNVVGLPLYETLSLLTGEGFVPPRPGAAALA